MGWGPRFRKLAEAVTAWLHFEKLCGREPLFSERYLAHAIGQFLIARYGRRVRSEYEHPVLAPAMKGPGNRPRIDFVVMHEKSEEIELAIETKWVSSSTSLVRDIVRDVVRLGLLAERNVLAVLVVGGHLKDIEEIKKSPLWARSLMHENSKPLMPEYEGSRRQRMHLEKPAGYRKELIQSACSVFQEFQIPSAVSLQAIKPPNVERVGDYQVLAWQIFSVPSHPPFRPLPQAKKKRKRSSVGS